MPTWTDNIVTQPAQLKDLLSEVKRVAVLGIKPESRASAAAHYVPAYLVEAGLEVIPVPTYYPEVTTILGRPVVRSLRDVPGPIDLVNVFRRSEDIPAHLDDLLAAKPRVVWFQLGIRNDAVARALADANILVVQDRCLMVDHRRWVRP